MSTFTWEIIQPSFDNSQNKLNLCLKTIYSITYRASRKIVWLLNAYVCKHENNKIAIRNMTPHMYKLIFIAWILVTNYHCLGTPGGTSKNPLYIRISRRIASAKRVSPQPVDKYPFQMTSLYLSYKLCLENQSVGNCQNYVQLMHTKHQPIEITTSTVKLHSFPIKSQKTAINLL